MTTHNLKTDILYNQEGAGRGNCPICNSEKKEPVSKIEFELFDGHPMDGGYDVVQCCGCGFIYADTAVTQQQLDTYYTDLSKYEDKAIATGGGFTENDRNRLSDNARFISKHVPDKAARIADLGCSNGGLLKELKNEGFTDVTGIDPSAICVNITKAEVGCPCFQYSIFDIPDSVGQFDVIALTHVLEHILNVQEAAKVIYRLLKPGGLVYIECPNAAHYKEVIHAPFQEFNAEHINHFTETSFENLMGITGFEKIASGDKVFKIASDQDYHAVYGLFRKANAFSYNIQFDSTTRGAIDEYIAKSAKIFAGINDILNGLPTDRPVALLGIGQFAFKLLKTGPFRNSKNYRLFDNSAMTIGKQINGIKIKPGADIFKEYQQEKFSIVISSLIHEKAIRQGIEKTFREHDQEPPEMVGFSSLL